MIRDAHPDDVPVLADLIRALADYEREPEAAVATDEQLRTALFGPDAVASALVAEEEGVVVGTAVWFRNFSTWRGVPGIYLEDLFVRPETRGRGHGGALLAALARICDERGYRRLEWSVLDWNEPAIEFYQALGAKPQDEWTTYRLEGAALWALAGRGKIS